VDGVRKLIIHLCHQIIFMKRRIETTGVLLKRNSNQDWVLQCAFPIEKVEESIPHNGSSEAPFPGSDQVA